MKLFALFALFIVSLEGVTSLSCFCGIQPCQLPACCPSGFYVKDECGCCLRCAKAEGEECGGPFAISGFCSTGTRCLKKCECKTVEGKSCLFPFTYNGETFTTCTKANSENGRPWCATQVDKDGVVVTNTWEDCDSGCPGSDFVCDETFLSNNANGRCVNSTQAPSLLREAQSFQSAATLENDYTGEFIPAPVCQPNQRDSVKKCRCARGEAQRELDGTPRGGCIPPLEAPVQDLENGWCFLEHIQDPKNPSQDCYEDVQWSASDARWWSSLACNEEPLRDSGVNSAAGTGVLNARSQQDSKITFEE